MPNLESLRPAHPPASDSTDGTSRKAWKIVRICASVPAVAAVLAGCSRPPQEPVVVQTFERFQGNVERLQQPFDAVNSLRGPGLHINGMRLKGEPGPVLLMASTYDEGREVVFSFTPDKGAPWPPESDCEAPGSGGEFRVSLAGAGDLSHNAVRMAPDLWVTSLDGPTYAKLPGLDFTLCGHAYALPNEYRKRFEAHRNFTHKGAAFAEKGQRRQRREACDSGNSKACLALAGMFLKGEGGEADPEAALGLYQEECDRGNALGCLGGSQAIRTLHPPKPGNETHYRKAEELTRRACGMKGKTEGLACLEAAILHSTGFGSPADPGLVQGFATASCEQGFRYTCGLRDDLIACASGRGTACATLAQKESGKSNRDPVKESLWLQAACRQGHAASCP